MSTIKYVIKKTSKEKKNNNPRPVIAVDCLKSRRSATQGGHGAPNWIRTSDQRIMSSLLLTRLSYRRKIYYNIVVKRILYNTLSATTLKV